MIGQLESTVPPSISNTLPVTQEEASEASTQPLVAEPVADPGPAGTAASLTELGAILRWLGEPGVRLVEADPPLRLPLTSAHRVADQVARAAAAQRALPAGDDAPLRGRQPVPAKVSRLRV